MTPEAETDQQQAGHERDDAATRRPTRPSRSPIPAIVTTKPATIRVLCGRRLASRSAASDETRMPTRRRGEDDAGLDRVVAANLLQEDGDDERDAHEQQPLDVLGDQPEVGGAVPEQRRGAAAVPCPRARERGCRGRTQTRKAAPTASSTASSASLLSAWRIPNTTKNMPTAGQDRSDRVEGARRVGRERDRRSGG